MGEAHWSCLTQVLLSPRKWPKVQVPREGPGSKLSYLLVLSYEVNVSFPLLEHQIMKGWAASLDLSLPCSHVHQAALPCPLPQANFLPDPIHVHSLYMQTGFHPACDPVAYPLHLNRVDTFPLSIHTDLLESFANNFTVFHHTTY